MVGGSLSVTNELSEFFNTVEAFDPATGTWTTKAVMPSGRGSLAAGVVNGLLYAVGGRDSSSSVRLNEAYAP
jgi:hypothetical protein